jgi:uncharacterized protein (DUF486 family)
LAPALQGSFAFLLILISWGLAFVEYCLAVPANRYGSAVYNPAQLKAMQEVITLVVFQPGLWLFANRSRRLLHVSQVVK